MVMHVDKGGPRAMADINVTPLVDVMLVLLVIFMITTPLITEDETEREVDIDLPVTRDNPNVVDLENTEKLILQIDSELRVTLRGTDAVITDCSGALANPGPEAFEPCFVEIQEKLGSNPRLEREQSLYLLADTAIPYGFVVGAMNRIRLAGVHNVGMVTNPEYLTEEQR